MTWRAVWPGGMAGVGGTGRGPGPLPACPLHSLFDIYVSEHTDDRLRALEESKPGLKIVY